MGLIQVPQVLGVGVSLTSGAGSPEGIVTAGIGSLYLQTDAIDGSILWGKISGTGATGWSLLFNMSAGDITTITDAIDTIKLDTTMLKRRVDIEAFVTAGQNDGDGLIITNLNWIGRFGLVDISSKQAYVLGSAVVATPLSYRLVDGRSAYQLNSASGGGRAVLTIRPFNQTFFKLDFRDTMRGLTTADVGAGVQPPEATVYMSWIRKKASGDSTSCLECFGFQNSRIASPSLKIPRAGLLGDGASGFRYGSVNCPDAFVTVAENAATDIDANSVQPSDLVSPGANWFHAAIKIVPPLSAAQGGRWGAYHNGQLVGTFSTTTNFPRGSAGVSTDDYTMNEVQTYIGNTDLSMMFYKTRYVITQDTDLGPTLTF